MRTKVILVTLAMLLLLTSCAVTVPSETEKPDMAGATDTGSSEMPKPEVTPFMYEQYESQELIPDLSFKRGINIHSQKDHSNGDTFTSLGYHSFYGGDAKAPKWGLAQWDSGPSLTAESVGNDDTELTDNYSKLFRYDPASNIMTFRLNTAAYYNGKPSREGDYWPHLLIEQPEFVFGSNLEKQKQFYSCSADAIVCSFDIKLDDYNITEIEGDWVRAAQFLMYFYVKGTKTNDFCWFGLQLFDNRRELNDHYIGYDGGKADASGAMIFSIGSKYIYTSKTLYKDGKPNPGGDWIHVSVDIKPFLEEMFEYGKKDNYFKANSLDELIVNGMNLGWETIGTFDHTMSVKDLHLTSYVKKSD